MLKEHQLFYYGKMHHTTAYGVMNLLGYSVAMGKTSDKKFHFEALPPDKHLRTFHFYCETAAERDRCSEKSHDDDTNILIMIIPAYRWVGAMQRCTGTAQ